MLTQIPKDRPIVVFDFDKTITQKHTFWRFLLFAVGPIKFWRTVLQFFPEILKVRKGQQKLLVLREQVIEKLLTGLSEKEYEKMNASFAQEKIPALINPIAIEKLHYHKKQNHFIVLLSNATEGYLTKWAKNYNFDLVLGSRLEIVNRNLTGKLIDGHCFAHGKVKRLEAVIGDLSDREIYAYGDSRGDKEIFSHAQKVFYKQFAQPLSTTNTIYKNDNPIESHEVLIVGAGPVGLTLACELAAQGISFRIIEKESVPHKESRAFAVHARTLELLNITGVAEKFISEGKILKDANIYYKDKLIFKNDFQLLKSKFPLLLILPQYKVQEILEQHLNKYNVFVERGVELENIDNEGTLPKVKLHHKSGKTEQLIPSWVIAADGAKSKIRKQLKVPFEGNKDGRVFIVIDSDIKYKQPVETVNTYLNNKGYILIVPFKEKESYRLVVEADEKEFPDETIHIDQVKEKLADNGFEVEIKSYKWISKSKIQKRIVSTYKVNRVFIAGDAAHIHSPVGGQGMNLGIQDAFNLAWKLAFVIKGKAKHNILFSYNDERRKVALDVLSNTGRLSKLLIEKKPVKRNIRNILLKTGNRLDKFKLNIVNNASGLSHNYKESILTYDGSDLNFNLNAGDRFPDSDLVDYFSNLKINPYEILRNRKFNLFIYCTEEFLETKDYDDLMNAESILEEGFLEMVDIHLMLNESPKDLSITNNFASVMIDQEGGWQRKLFDQKAICLVRPDGYICCILEQLNLKGIDLFLKRFFSIYTKEFNRKC